ncbi:MAG: calcium-binding protein, partial [Pseudohongiellaceae bacterium]
TLDGYAIPNVEVIVTDDDKGTLLIAETDRDTVVLEGTTGEITDSFDVSLPFAPTDDVTVTLALQDPANPQITLSTNTLTFTTGNWMNPQTVTVEAINDTDEENPGRNTIVYTLTSNDPVFTLTSDQLPETAVTVLDDDTAGVIVNESEGSTQLVMPDGGSPGVGDDYTMRLTSAPTDDVTVNIFTDGGTKIDISGAVILNELNNFTADVEFIDYASAGGFNANVLFVSDSGVGSDIATVLANEGHTVTSVLDAYSGGTVPALQGDLSAYDAIFWSASGNAYGDLHTDAAMFTNLQDYVTNGGRVFVTGYDSIASPTDSPLINFLGGAGTRDVVGPPSTPAQGVNSLTTGVVDIKGVTPTGYYPDTDTLMIGEGTNTITVVGTNIVGGASWSLRTLGTGEIAYISNGQYGTTGSHSSWTNEDPGGSGAYNAAIRNFAFNSTADDDAYSDTIVRTDGVSWASEGIRIGSLIQVSGSTSNNISGTAYYKVNNISSLEADGGLTLTLTGEASLADEIANGATIKLVAPAVTFTAANWFNEQTINIEADPEFQPPPGSEVAKGFEQSSHVASKLEGPLIIEGGSTEADRSLRTATMLPTENPEPPLEVDLITDETSNTDRLIIYNDTSVIDDNGVLTSNRLTGLGMGDSDITIPGTGGDPDVVVQHGITYAGLDVLEVLLGSGNDNFDIDVTPVSHTADLVFAYDVLDGATLTFTGGSSGDNFIDQGFRVGDSIIISGAGDNDGRYSIRAISVDGSEILLNNSAILTDVTTTATLTIELPLTIIHGGGNRETSPGVMGGDTITVTGGGFSQVPVVIFGDTSQDGKRYSAPLGVLSIDAPPFDDSGDDVIDASASTSGVVIYGGAGNDTIHGSQGNDQIAGGSGDDQIFGEAGDDHIYGDGGINVDSTTRVSISPQVLMMVTAPDITDAINSDDLGIGQDTIQGDAGNDIILADHGVIEQGRTVFPDDLRILNIGNVTAVYSVRIDEGGDDVITDSAGDNMIIGGFGADMITTLADGDVIIGDNGQATYTNGVLTRLESTDIDDTTGAVDIIDAGDGINRIIGGAGADQITGGDDANDIIGDHGFFTYTTDGFLDSAETKLHDQGAGDTIHAGAGGNTVLGGQGADLITSASVAGFRDILIGDNGQVLLTSNIVVSFRSTDDDDLTGADDVINGGDADTYALGGTGMDTITTGLGNDSILGDHGEITYNPDGSLSHAVSTLTDQGDVDSIDAGDGDNLVIAGFGG